MRFTTSIIFTLLYISIVAQPTFQKQIRSASIQVRDSIFGSHDYVPLDNGSLHVGVTSYVNIVASEPTIVKLDEQGNALWTKRRFNSLHFSSSISAFGSSKSSLIQRFDDQFTFVTSQSMTSFTNRKCLNCMMVTSIDTSLNVLWETLIQGAAVSNIVQFRDGSYALVVDRTPTRSDRNFHYLIFMSAEGQITQQYLLSKDWYIHHLAVTADDELLFAGANDVQDSAQLIGSFVFPSLIYKSGLFGKMSKEGEVMWVRTSEDIVVQTTEQTRKGTFILLASGANDEIVRLLEVDTDGIIRWIKQVPLRVANLSGHISLNSNDEIYLKSDGVIGNVFSGLDERNSTQISKLTSLGEPLWTRRIPYSFPFKWEDGIFEVTAEGAIRCAYAPDDPGVLTISFTNVQLEANGELTNCQLPKICIESEAIDENWQDTMMSIIGAVEDSLIWQEIEGTTWGEVPSFTWLDNCIPVEFPSADFEVVEGYCANSALSVIDLPDDEFDNYEWTLPNASPEQSQERDPGNFSYQNAGTFDIQLIATLNNCPDTVVKEVQIITPPNFDLGSDTLLCEATTFNIDGTFEDFATYRWSDGVELPQRTLTNSGQYILEAIREGCEVKDSIRVDFLSERFPNNPIRLGRDTTICEEETYTLNASVDGVDSYLWMDGETNPQRQISTAGNYMVQANIQDCFWEAAVQIETQDCEGRLYVPNVFSPNGDGNNDLLEWHGQQIEMQVFQIFDRWGNLMFESVDDFWDGFVDGKLAPEGSYTYHIIFESIIQGKQEQLTGSLQLMR